MRAWTQGDDETPRFVEKIKACMAGKSGTMRNIYHNEPIKYKGHLENGVITYGKSNDNEID